MVQIAHLLTALILGSASMSVAYENTYYNRHLGGKGKGGKVGSKGSKGSNKSKGGNGKGKGKGKGGSDGKKKCHCPCNLRHTAYKQFLSGGLSELDSPSIDIRTQLCLVTEGGGTTTATLQFEDQYGGKLEFSASGDNGTCESKPVNENFGIPPTVKGEIAIEMSGTGKAPRRAFQCCEDMIVELCNGIYCDRRPQYCKNGVPV